MQHGENKSGRDTRIFLRVLESNTRVSTISGSGRVRPQVGKVGSDRTTIRDTRVFDPSILPLGRRGEMPPASDLSPSQ